MGKIRILSWNVNGIRAVEKKGFLKWLNDESPDILCLQETKAHPDQLGDALKNPEGYRVYWSSAERKGYSGVGTYTRQEPVKVSHGFGIERFDSEGRILITEYPGFTLFNIYFPNGKMNAERLRYKMDFYNACLEYLESLRKEGGKLVICGDYNTAHKEIDLAHPKENSKVSGFLPVEREWMDKLVAYGYADTFRRFNQEPGQYSWWDFKSRARERNIGWRIDYFFVSENLADSVTSAFIMQQVEGSDHCPVGIDLVT